LFVGRHNSVRSQKAEAFLNQMGNDRYVAESTGLYPNKMLPSAVEVMQEIGFIIADKDNDPWEIAEYQLWLYWPLR
jgi:arsenate reductase